ncbi:MAG: xanthine dehydrogenase small subunit, partial [Betaproteobacteria bacterium]|nr:xanthine dehydrogenase small subunit [Betaproteobacteria bacterium]
ADGKLHPVQRAMMDCHGSQCGFCTPGFVMSLFAQYLQHPRLSREQAVEALSGNLCRCTGYRPILEAAARMGDYPEPAIWSRDDAHSEARTLQLQSLQREAGLQLSASPGFYAPLTVDELATRYAEQPQSLLLAGGTDIGLWVTKQLRDLPPIIYLGEVASLNTMAITAKTLEIGAGISLAEAFAAIVAHYPMLAELADRFASVPIRNSGTLCGNIANGSPIGDAMPILIALGASLQLRCGDKTRTIALGDLYLDYQKKALARGEFVQSVSVPLPVAGLLVASYKISKRYDQDISAVCAGYAFEVVEGRIASARIAYGGMAAIPKSAAHTEAALIGKPWSRDSIASAVAQLGEDFQPLADMRASAEYRLRVAGNLLLRFYTEHAGTDTPLRVYDSTLAAD